MRPLAASLYCSKLCVCCVQRQLDSLSTFVRQRLRSSGQRATIASETASRPLSVSLEDRGAAEDGGGA